MPVEHCIAMSFLRRLPPLFFIGLFPVVCLLWLWADSMQHRTTWRRCCGTCNEHLIRTFPSGINIRHIELTDEMPAPGTTNIYNYTPPGPTTFFGEITRARLGSGPGKSSAWAAPSTSEGRMAPRGFDFMVVTRVWHLPYWLILACYLPLWLLLTWWQARRREKKRHAAMPSGDGHHE